LTGLQFAPRSIAIAFGIGHRRVLFAWRQSMDHQRVSCAACTFWVSRSDHNGYCKQLAPRPTEQADEIAYWPETVDTDSCGEGLEGPRLQAMTHCENCRFWRRSPDHDGIYPVDRLGARSAWWQEAGHCVRHAPGPASTAGHRGFWRVTHRTGQCSQGKERVPAK
jgi:hypothetical protein